MFFLIPWFRSGALLITLLLIHMILHSVMHFMKLFFHLLTGSINRDNKMKYQPVSKVNKERVEEIAQHSTKLKVMIRVCLLKLLFFNIWLINGISIKFAPAMNDRRERIRSLLHFKILKERAKT